MATIQEVGVEQIDGAIHTGLFHCLVETKDQDKPKNIEPIAKIRNQLLRRPAATVGLIFSHSGFTEPAKLLASFISPQTILLWSGEETCWAIREKKLVLTLDAKFRHAVEYGIPDFDPRVSEGLS